MPQPEKRKQAVSGGSDGTGGAAELEHALKYRSRRSGKSDMRIATMLFSMVYYFLFGFSGHVLYPVSHSSPVVYTVQAGKATGRGLIRHRLHYASSTAKQWGRGDPSVHHCCICPFMPALSGSLYRPVSLACMSASLLRCVCY